MTMSTGTFCLDKSLVAKVIGGTATVLNDLPYAGMVLSVAQCALEAVQGANAKASYDHIKALNRGGNSTESGEFSKAIALKFTLIRKDDVVAMSQSTSGLNLDRDSFLVRLLKEFADNDSVDSWLGKRDFPAVELKALEDSKEALDFILSGKVIDASNLAVVIDSIAEGVTNKVQPSVSAGVSPTIGSFSQPSGVSTFASSMTSLFSVFRTKKRVRLK